ncbi:MAG: conjugative transfer signal peptidase TraF [Myxococcaceae bacterium]|nr:conjugative transfer signal peptidase TraF [Myxococcaceae bacterium]
MSGVDHKRTTRWLEGTTNTFIGFCALLLAAKWVGLQLVYTPSVPMGVYLRSTLAPTAPLERGDYVCLEGWRSSAPAGLQDAVRSGVGAPEWLRDEPLVKRVVGLPRDRIENVTGSVEINGQLLPNSIALERDRHGLELPQPPYPVVLGEDEVWLASSHPRGFDSRYYGAVKRSALGCRTRLLWAW